MSEQSIAIYIAEGGALFVCNAIFGTATVFVMRRRSAFVLIGAMLAADAIYGLSFLLTGVDFWKLYSEGDTDSLVTQEFCIRQPRNLLILFAIPSTAMMQFAVSFDRILAVFHPVKYRKFSNLYGIKMVAFVSCVSFANVVYFALFFSSPSTMVPRKCTVSSSIGVTARQILSIFRIAFTATSVIAYIPVLWHMNKPMKQVSNFAGNFVKNNPSSLQQRLAKRLNQSAMLNGLNTFALFNVPDVYLYVSANNASGAPLWITAMLMGRGLVSTIIFVTRHGELRDAIRRTAIRIRCYNATNNNTHIQHTGVLP